MPGDEMPDGADGTLSASLQKPCTGLTRPGPPRAALVVLRAGGGGEGCSSSSSTSRAVWCPQRDSNPCYRLERAASWATRR
ncbi:hypothetical protein SCOCK_730019 [Actinacidiphila cocklensis]|uniref:Uncharacterized protein n=1 Tax=Actinacidiphila cocklensis TaxID=887465 RepID=A0A9W4E3C8_9ACTN|nr:hypothetical protein SCOCK_730019 [Actinacidiphila cocklensis]